jgi:hypothetical protein
VVEGVELGVGLVGHQAGAVRGGVDVGVVVDDQHVVAGHPQIALEHLGAVSDGPLVAERRGVG